MNNGCNIFDRPLDDDDEPCGVCGEHPGTVWGLCPACFVDDDDE